MKSIYSTKVSPFYIKRLIFFYSFYFFISFKDKIKSLEMLVKSLKPSLQCVEYHGTNRCTPLYIYIED